MLEQHKKVTGSWPNTAIDSNEPFVLHGGVSSIDDLEELDISIWQLPDLQTYCMSNIVDLLLLEDFCPDNPTFKGELARFEPDIEYLKSYAERMLIE